MNMTWESSGRALLGTVLTCGALVLAAPQAEAAASASAYSQVILSITGFRDSGGNLLTDRPADLDISVTGTSNNSQQAFGGGTASASGVAGPISLGGITLTADTFSDASVPPDFSFGLAWVGNTGSLDITNNGASSYTVDFTLTFDVVGDIFASGSDFDFAEAQVVFDLSTSAGTMFPDWDELVDNFGGDTTFSNSGSFDFSLTIGAGAGGYVDLDVTTSAYAISQVPVPAALPLLASALAGLGVVARRRVAA